MQVNKEQSIILEIDNTLVADKNKIIEVPNQLFQKMLPPKTYQSSIQNNMKFQMVAQQKNLISNSFVQSVHMAYQYHHPLALSPDIIWLAIMQGFAIHVTQNSEKLRKKFVDFEGKKELVVNMAESDLNKINFQDAVDQFAGKIEENIGKRLTKTCIPKFSTSNNVTQVAFQMTLMGAMKSISNTVWYVDVEYLEQNYLELWKIGFCCEIKLKHSENLTLNDKLIAAYKGTIDKNFWNDIYQYRRGGPSMGPDSASGWITFFFPYEQFGENDFDRAELENEVAIEAIPNGQCKAPVKYINVKTNKSFQIQFISGFFGVVKDKEGFLSPKIGWAVCKE